MTGVDVAEVPVAVNITGEPVSDPLVAARVFVPAVVPSIQLPAVATPFAPVVTDQPVTEPPPDITAKVTGTPLTGLLYASLMMTAGAAATAVPAAADWLVAEFEATWVAGPAVPRAVNVTGEPVSDPLVAARVFMPAVVPSIQLPAVAIPSPPVVTDEPVTEPPPDITAKVTGTPLTGLLYASSTNTLGNVYTAVPAIAD